MQFLGYKRSEGRSGIRNHVLILPTCGCASETARMVASQVQGSVNVIINTGCVDVQANTNLTQLVLTGFTFNPNVFAVVIIGLGCEPVGNKEGGLSTLEEKSLGCIKKGGSRPLVEVLQEAMRPTKHGAIIMDTPGYDIASITSMVAGGCQLVAFTTGRGTPTGIALAPVIKITANKQTYKQMEDNMDLDVSGIIDGSLSLQQQGADAIFSEMLAVADGKITKAEAFGFSDVRIDHVCRFV